MQNWYENDFITGLAPVPQQEASTATFVCIPDEYKTLAVDWGKDLWQDGYPKYPQFTSYSSQMRSMKYWFISLWSWNWAWSLGSWESRMTTMLPSQDPLAASYNEKYQKTRLG